MINVVVQLGMTLWGLSMTHGVSLGATEAANPQIADPNLIVVGQVVHIPSGGGAVAPAASVSRNDGDADSDDPSAPAAQGDSTPGDDGGQAASPAGGVIQQAPISTSSPSSFGAAPGSFKACVIQRESGGNPSAVNPSSGAGGLFQFLPSTWASLGLPGLPQNASVALQNQAFNTLFAQMGTAPWASDGC